MLIHVTFKGVAVVWIPVAKPVHFIPKSTPRTLVDGGDNVGFAADGASIEQTGFQSCCTS